MIEIKNPLAEIEAMKVVAEALGPLEQDAQARILRWAGDVFGGPAAAPARPPARSDADQVQRIDKPHIAEESTQAGSPSAMYASVADFVAAAAPAKDAERALIVGYWFQILQGESDLDSHMINKELKHLGHGVVNITQTLNSLINKKPQLAIQTRKSGGSQQARKRYKITSAGQQVVERMLNKVE